MTYPYYYINGNNKYKYKYLYNLHNILGRILDKY